jgi:putative DNA primase/helicase
MSISSPNGSSNSSEALLARDAAIAYARGGQSVIPIRDDGSKAPALSTWTPYQTRRAEDPEIFAWYSNGQRRGVAVVGGRISGNAEHLDFDEDAPRVFPAWCDLVEAECPGLIARLSVRTTPREPAGYHVSYRCPEVPIPGNTKIASKPGPPDAKTGKPTVLGIIETRGEGGYVLAPGCPACCHPSGGLYQHFQGPKLSQIQTITAAEREVLWRCARSFDEMPQVQTDKPSAFKMKAENTRGVSPGDDFNARGPDWASILDGWTLVREHDGKGYWRRPGKEGPGWSATTGCKAKDGGYELLYVFSSNASPFEQQKAYSKFGAYALLRHAGNFSAAASELRRQGFGTQGSPSPEAPEGALDITIAALIEKHVPEQWQFTHRAEGKVWSAAKREYLGHTDFVQRSLWSWLRDQAALAKDAPHYRKGGLNPNALISAMKRELSVLWASRLATLPDLEDVPADSELGRGFRLALIRMWTVPRLHEAIRLPGGEHLIRSASLASKAQSWDYKPGAGWQRLHEGYDAWCRLGVDPDGKVDATLGMTWKLALQMGVMLPCVSNQKDLIRLGRRFAVIDAQPVVPSSTSYGKERLAVLTRALMGELLQEPTDEVEPQEATDEVES